MKSTIKRKQKPSLPEVLPNVRILRAARKIVCLFTGLYLFCVALSAVSPAEPAGITDEQKQKKAELTKQEKKEGFRFLFDGTSMDNWTGNPDYVLEDGCIVMRPSRKIGGNLYSKEEFDNFVLRFDFLLTPAANNGLGIRHEIVDTERGYIGMELQILDNEDPKYKELEPYQYHGSVYGIIPAKRGFLKPVGEWNTQEVIADGNRITVTLNGTVILDGDLAEATKDRPKEKIPAALFKKKGHIAFLGHGDVVKFRNIRVKPIQAPWKAGVASVVITPETPVWMAGYSSRTHASEGTIHDIKVKALAIEDTNGMKALLITADILGFPQDFSNKVRDELKKRFNLSKAQVILNSSHTHSGPVLPNSLVDIYNIDEAMAEKLKAYEATLEKKVLDVATQAFGNMKPARLYAQNGVARFQVNRRNNKEAMIATLHELKGPNDPAVPVIKVVSDTGSIQAIVFGYACHPTVLSGYLFCGDYPGFAQLALEKKYPEATALFFQGTGADQNPLPRRTVALAEQYGNTLAAAVDRVLKEEMKELAPQIQTAYNEIALPLANPPSKEELKNLSETKSGYQQVWAKRMLAQKEYPTTYPYPVQVWNLGGLPLVTLGGEVVIEYAIEAKKRLGYDTFVLGYSNDLMAYIPSATVLKEGGYEGADSQMVYGLPAPWKEGVDLLIYNEITQLAKKTGLPVTP